MCTEEKEFGGTKNVWIKRFGLLILAIGMFPMLAGKYWTEIEIVGKWMIIGAGAAYGIYLLKDTLRSLFSS